MKYLGLDLGSKTLGIAISDELGILARALETFRFDEDNYELAAKYTISICEKEKIKKVVLGMPKHMNGDLGVRAQISFDFKKLIEDNSDIEVILVDERLTTVMVDKTMIQGNVRRKDRRQKKDEMAAVIILQNYLDKMSF